MAIEWRFVGGRIVENGDDAAADSTMIVEPPIYDRAAVIERLLWADVVVMLSHWEGSPLLILEAQSVGTIPVATDVGAVSEMIRSGVDGILIPNGTLQSVVATSVVELQALVDDAPGRLRMAQNAISRLEEIVWQRTAAPLVAAVTSRDAG